MACCAAIAFILIYRNLPENYVREPHHPDALIHAGWTLLVLAVLYGVMQAGIVRGRFIPILVVAMIAGGIGLALVLWWEVKSPGNLFRSSAIRTRDMTMLIIMGALIQLALMGFYLPTFRYFDVVKGYGIWIRVLALAPILVGMLLALRIVGRIWNTQRVRRVMAVGLLLTGLSIVFMAIRPLHTHYLIQVIPLALFGYSILSTKTVWTNVFFRTVIDDYIGLNAGINSATLQIGGALGAMLVGELTAQLQKHSSYTPPVNVRGGPTCWSANVLPTPSSKILEPFGEECVGRDTKTRIDQLKEYLLTSFREGPTCVLLIHEASR